MKIGVTIAILKSSEKILLSINVLNMSHRDFAIIYLEIFKKLFETKFSTLGYVLLKTSFALFFLVFDKLSHEVNADSGISSASLSSRETKCSLNASEILSSSEMMPSSLSLTLSIEVAFTSLPIACLKICHVFRRASSFASIDLEKHYALKNLVL